MSHRDPLVTALQHSAARSQTLVARTGPQAFAAGVEFVTAVTEAPGGWSAAFKDPDGHTLSLYQDGALPR